MVTANIPPFTRQGTRLNATVASLADAKSLQGGILLQTPLVAGDGQVYAVAQGSVLPRGIRCGHERLRRIVGAKESQQLGRGHGRGAGGKTKSRPRFSPRACSKSCCARATSPPRCGWPTRSTTRSARLPRRSARPRCRFSSRREMQAPERQMEFVARIENAEFVPDVNARIVINERTGHGGREREHPDFQSGCRLRQSYGFRDEFAGSFAARRLHGQLDQHRRQRRPGRRFGCPATATSAAGAAMPRTTTAFKPKWCDRTTTNVEEEKRALVVFKDLPTVEDVAFALNSMGATPRELMSILQSIKDAGGPQRGACPRMSSMDFSLTSLTPLAAARSRGGHHRWE